MPGKALSLGERVPAGTVHLGLLDAPDLTVGRGEGVPEVEVEVAGLVLRRPCRDRAVLDVRRGLADAEHRARVNTGLRYEFALRRAGQRGIDRLKVAARLQDDPVGAVLDKKDLGAADQQRAGSRRVLPPYPRSPRSLALKRVQTKRPADSPFQAETARRRRRTGNASPLPLISLGGNRIPGR